MQTKYTQGEWTLAGNPLQVVEYNGGRGPFRLIVEAWHGDQITGTGNSGISFDEAKGNARLAAAAPELLEALQALAGAVDSFVNGAEDWPELQLARAAIAKVLGETT